MKKIELKYCIELIDREDYQEIGNSRIGGLPDLAKNINYPEFKLPENFSSIKYEGGYYSFLLQLNLSNQNIPELPSEGLLSIFYGSIENKVFGFYFSDESKLELRRAKKENYYCWTDEYPNVSHKFKLAQIISEDHKDYKDYSEEFTEAENIYHWKYDFLRLNSYLFDEPINSKWELYSKSQGLNLLQSGYGIVYESSSNSLIYSGQNANLEYTSFEDLEGCRVTNFYESYGSTKEEWLSQVRIIEERKEYHLANYLDFVCLLSLDSNYDTEMIWGDNRKMEIFGFKSEFKEKNFSNLWAAIL